MIDLHMHTSASDGALAPEALVERWASVGVSTLSITDHDTIEGWRAAGPSAQAHGVRLVPGVELSTSDARGRPWHVLGYFFDPESTTLGALIAKIRSARTVRNEEILRRLVARGFVLTMADVVADARGVIGRPHFARALVRTGAVASMEEAFERYLGDGKPCAVEQHDCTPAEAATALHAAGGVAILAHPLSLGRAPEQARNTIQAALKAGLDGIEAHYGGHSDGEVRMILSFARQQGALVSGGSDAHGRERPTGARGPRSEGLTPPEAFTQLERRAERYRS